MNSFLFHTVKFHFPKRGWSDITLKCVSADDGEVHMGTGEVNN